MDISTGSVKENRLRGENKCRIPKQKSNGSTAIFPQRLHPSGLSHQDSCDTHPVLQTVVQKVLETSQFVVAGCHSDEESPGVTEMCPAASWRSCLAVDQLHCCASVIVITRYDPK